MQEELKGHCCHIKQDQDVFKSQAENQVSLCEDNYGDQSSAALPLWLHKLSPRPKSTLTPATKPHSGAHRAAKTVSRREEAGR